MDVEVKALLKSGVWLLVWTLMLSEPLPSFRGSIIPGSTGSLLDLASAP
jgi:hypothetical protein